MKTLIDYLKEQKSKVFSDENTWRSSGPPWSENAQSEEIGYDKCIEQINKFFTKKTQKAGDHLGPPAS
jgi:hypothetical protein